jgi:hypothetical protein
MSRERTGPLVSSQASRTDEDWHADPVELEHILDGTQHRAMEAVERPHQDRADAAGSRVGQHPVEGGARLAAGSTSS